MTFSASWGDSLGENFGDFFGDFFGEDFVFFGEFLADLTSEFSRVFLGDTVVLEKSISGDFGGSTDFGVVFDKLALFFWGEVGFED